MGRLEAFTNAIRAIAALVAAGAFLWGIAVLHRVVTVNIFGIGITFGHPDFANDDLVADVDAHYQIQFWTPSAKTKDTPGVAEWLKMDNDSKLDDFADALMKGDIVSGVQSIRSYWCRTWSKETRRMVGGYPKA